MLSLAFAVLGIAAAAFAERPSVVFVLLDTTRADRFGAWGHPGGTTPVLDALAARGVRFARHYADSHATRPSMPQLMSGRYYRGNILGPFQPNAHPREMAFANPDPSSRLLPELLHGAGYATAGVSAHTWVSPDSELGRAFDHFELVSFSTKEAHGDAKPVVDRAIALWRARDAGRPMLLYVHLMDMHIPRRVPEGVSPNLVDGYDWRTRFRPNGEPAFDSERRAWSRYDASDFTADDRAYYARVYDARLRYADAQVGRLLAAVEESDPGLRNTVVVVTADHGEELAEDGRIEHSDSLADGIQHVPLIVAGGAVAPGQRCDGGTEHVDVVPTVAAAIGVSLPPGMTVDGTAWIHDGRLPARCGGATVFYAWEEYRAVRRGRYLLVEHPHGAPATGCEGERRLYRLEGDHRHPVDPAAAARRSASLQRQLEARLGARERAYRAHRYHTPSAPFLVRSEFARLEPADMARCVVVSSDTPKASLLAPGWFWTGRGLALTSGHAPLAAHLDVPDGTYRVEAATTPIPPAPWLFGVRRWRRRAFRHDDPSTYLALGTVQALGGSATITVPPGTLEGQHVLAFRLIPPGAGTATAPGLDREQQERLRALGYVQ